MQRKIDLKTKQDMRYSFAGHETFYCKSLWLKKGYDFLKEGNSFLDNDAVIKLGVGKNMVASIRYWMKAFGLTVNDQLTLLADYIFNKDTGCDMYLEDINTLWLLHYNLVSNRVASLYYLLFVDYQREKKEFDRELLTNYIKRRCSVPEQKNVYNENTVKKDVGVLLHNYVAPESLNSLEDFSGLLINLNLLCRIEKDSYAFIETNAKAFDSAIILYAILEAGAQDPTLSFDKIQEMSLIFGLSVSQFIEIVRGMESKHPTLFHYSETSGVRNIQFTGKVMDKFAALTRYYYKPIAK